jgi:MFS family permease
VRDRTKTLTVTSITLLSSVLVWFNYSAVLPFVVEEWGLSPVRAGIVFGAFQAGYLLTIVPLGMLADRTSPRLVIAAGATGTGLASLGFALIASGFVSAVILRAFAGACMAGVYVPGMRLVSDWYPETDRGSAMGLYVGMFSLGSGLSFFISSPVAATVGWRTAIAVTSVGAVAAGPFVFATTRDVPDNRDRATRGVDFDFSILRNRRYLAAVSTYAWHNWELFAVRNWMVAFLLTTVAVGGSTFAGLLTGGMIVLGGVGNLIGGWVSDRIGRARTATIALGTSGFVSAVIGTLTSVSLAMLVVAIGVYGVVLTADSAPISTAVTETVPAERRGTALAVQSLAGFAPTVVSPIVFGAVLGVAGYGWAFRTLALGAVFGVVSALLLDRVRNGTSRLSVMTERHE